MRDSWKNIGLVVCVIIMLIYSHAQAESETEVIGVPQVSVFKQDDGFGVWNLVIKTREGRPLVCYEDGRNLEVMRNTSDLVQSVIKHNNGHKSKADEKGEIAVIGDYDRKNDLLNINRIICLESVQGKNRPQELVLSTDYNDKTATLHNRYVIFDEVGAVYNSISTGVGVPFWGRFWVGNFGVNYAWPDPWGAYHYWRRPHIVGYCWDGVFYWRTPHFRRPYWRYSRWRPWYWKRHYRTSWYRIDRPWYWKPWPTLNWGYRRSHDRYRTHRGPYFDRLDRKRNLRPGRQFKRLRSQGNGRLRSPRSSPTRRTYVHGLGFGIGSSRYVHGLGFRSRR